MLGMSSDKLLNSLFDGLYCVDLDRRISFWNSAAQRITGYSAEEVLGSNCHDSILRRVEVDGYECEVKCPLAATIADGKVREANVLVHHKHGYRLPVQVRTSPVRNEEGAIVGAVEIFTDNSNSVQILAALEQLKQDVLVDPLTGVGNRRLADMSLESRLHDWQTHRRPFGVLFMDVDHFKSVNDRYGHKTGDEVLRMLGKTISNTFRKVDTVARWGGEEFVAILPAMRLPALASIAERIRSAVAGSFLMEDGQRVGVTLSIGGTIAETGDNAESIISRADAQMYRSKAGGRNLVTLR
ncbi:sensor diguanylate cyclase, PAS domain-containing [Citrifermentans bemidjiense Bem]|uniref:Sensor diguanylate cyclase, PAS domain-containing n=1 Tax=Citrifermentans bemidjiense (strain ATCC BAA-1014 / DSM 16622 / JCM 12645 / Bem) TaxID=404380 RepID=B5EAI5_CITBB|nr:sensor domain-containing diguanylate cyclase [Citrifermentans bemidjiense]ACH40324.1 sensor diguanylate cyclase, PAS domain-containing [Citrifermentans bemidjiense Bem]